MLRFFVLFAAIAAIAQGYSKGAPKEVCESMIPGHPADPQKGKAPYRVTIDKTVIKPGDRVTVTLEGENGEKFKGYLVEARVGNTIVGSFDVANNDKQAQTIDCPNGLKNAVTHRNKDDKNKVELIWVAPKDLEESVVFLATFVKDGLVFWVSEASPKLAVHQ